MFAALNEAESDDISRINTKTGGINSIVGSRDRPMAGFLANTMVVGAFLALASNTPAPKLLNH